MPLLHGILVLLLCQTAGEAIKAYFQISLPGPVIGMLILFIGLCCYRGIPTAIGKSSQILIPLLGLMFLPAAAGLFFLGNQYDNQWPAIITAVVLGSLLSLVFNSLLMKALSKKQERQHE